jgi:UDP-N-acetylglucosamine--N-acetylmuramyl-(pentapeptide) pyrophosphoryl-undecaprenol N-acetylglucosamine transferase
MARASWRALVAARPTRRRANRHDGAVNAAPKKIAIAAGGTAGHVVPALAVADALRAEGAQVTFIGGDRAEAQLVPAAGYGLRTISVEGMSRTNPLRAASALVRAAAAVLHARGLLGELDPDVVFGGGGYVPDFTPTRQDARERFGLAPREPCVLVFGGSLGARSINRAALDAFSSGTVRVLHVCGRREYQELCAKPLPLGYDLREYLELEDFAYALSAADIVVARAGGSVFEIAAHGLPAILVPYPQASADHQSTNARWMSDAGAAITIADGELTAARLAREVAQLLATPTRLAAMAGASRRLARPGAAREIATEILEAACP